MSLKLNKLVTDFGNLKLLTNDIIHDIEITVSEISRPGLELTGYTQYYPYRRVQVFGMNEVSYLESTGYQKQVLDKMIIKNVPAMIFCRDLKPSQEFIDKANEIGVPIYTTCEATSKFTSKLFNYLEYELAPQTQIHGVLVSVYGKGVLIRGASGVGKSEVALELINRGHILVADDAIVIKKVDDTNLIGSAPTLLKNRLEIRGVGIVDIQKLYGVTKVINSKRISLVAELKPLNGTEDRIGNASKFETILDCEVPKVEIPITIGRSVSNLIEVAVANFGLKTEYGYDSAQSFIDDLNTILADK